MARIVVRVARPADRIHAAAASRLIRRAAVAHDLAQRSAALLRDKIEHGRAAIALIDDELVGFGFFSEWESGEFVSHSGLVVRDDLRGKGLGRRLKRALLDASMRLFPRAKTMSITTSPAVLAMNASLGFVRVPLSRLTKDEAFWDGCRTCRNFASVRRAGKKCCCFGMLKAPAPRESLRSASRRTRRSP